MAESVLEEKVRNHIPFDISFSILSKLPLKSLKRFECVCKSWSLLFEDSHFMNKFRTNFISKSHSYYNDTSLILYQVIDSLHCSFYLLSGERFENRVKLDLPNPFQVENPFFDFVDCDIITGTLCLNKQKTLVLWNPTTNEFKVLPPSLAESIPPYREASTLFHGFGYDHIQDDIKVIRYVHFCEINGRGLRLLNVRREDVPRNEISYEPLWEIYSVRCNSWRKLDFNMPKCWTDSSNERLCLNGICHWWHVTEDRDEHFLVSFDFSNEMFFTTEIPLDIPSDIDTNLSFRLTKRHLVVFNGSIASISWYLDTTTFHISILGELGVKESWTKLFVVGPLLYIERLIGVGKNGDIFLKQKDGQLVCFDLHTQKTEKLGVMGAHFYIAIYKKSLVSIGGINQ